MHVANHYYGHAHILASYCDLPEPPVIWGYLQHGWNILDGFAVGTQFAPDSRKLVWSPSVARRGWAMGRRGYLVVGSPFAYLLRLRAAQIQAARNNTVRAGTIYYPFHGWEGQEVLGDHARLAATIIDEEGGAEGNTVCLYWAEFGNPLIRRTYEDVGFRVISHGYRGLNYRGTDKEFLERQLSELLRHSRVASNRLGSAVLYGVAVGCSAGVYGDPMDLSYEHAAFGGISRQRRLWPELHSNRIPTEIARSFADGELGLSFMMEPMELAGILGWSMSEASS